MKTVKILTSLHLFAGVAQHPREVCSGRHSAQWIHWGGLCVIFVHLYTSQIMSILLISTVLYSISSLKIGSDHGSNSSLYNLWRPTDQVVHGHTKQLEKLQGLSDEMKKKLENTETEISKVETFYSKSILIMWVCQINHQFSPTKPRCWFWYVGNVFLAFNLLNMTRTDG